MPLEAPLAPVSERVIDLNDRYRHHGATAVLEHALSDPQVGRIGLVSSFGAESVVLLHLLSVLDRTTPVLFIDTEMLFAETLAYQSEVAETLGLTNIVTVKADPLRLAFEDPDNTLHQFNTDACCAIRKTEPLERALSGFDAWITGRKRYQGQTRANVEFFEAEGDIRIKVNPLAHWGREDLQDYMINNRLPRHPLVAMGYPSIGCAPCTSPVAEGEDPRAGRWRGSQKTECGIHFINGRAVRVPASQENAA
jgi:phosphoadenosine phosphosulfate reductase